MILYEIRCPKLNILRILANTNYRQFTKHLNKQLTTIRYFSKFHISRLKYNFLARILYLREPIHHNDRKTIVRSFVNNCPFLVSSNMSLCEPFMGIFEHFSVESILINIS